MDTLRFGPLDLYFYIQSRIRDCRKGCIRARLFKVFRFWRFIVRNKGSARLSLPPIPSQTPLLSLSFLSLISLFVFCPSILQSQPRKFQCSISSKRETETETETEKDLFCMLFLYNPSNQGGCDIKSKLFHKASTALHSWDGLIDKYIFYLFAYLPYSLTYLICFVKKYTYVDLIHE